MNAMHPADMTLDELANALVPLLVENAPFDGWGEDAQRAAAKALGVPPERGPLAFSGGAVDAIDRWFGQVDAAMLAAVPPEALAPMRVSERVRALLLQPVVAAGIGWWRYDERLGALDLFGIAAIGASLVLIRGGLRAGPKDRT